LTLKRNVKITAMKKYASFFIIITLALAYSCKDEESDRFKFLTGTVWTPVSLLANGVDATGPGGLLEGFVGDAKFNEDGTGTFGTYTGTWSFDPTEEKIIITAQSLGISVTLIIEELTSTSLKLEGSVPDLQNITAPAIPIEMTFRAK
jgi:hypothetical protein